MARKRGFEETEPTPEETPQRELKQSKTDAAAQAATEADSEASYVSAAAAVFSESEGTSETGQSSRGDSDSELSSSSEEPSSDESDEEDDYENESDVDAEGERRRSDVQDEVTNLRPGRKPEIRKEHARKDLLEKIRSFLPELEEANEQLEKERAAGTLDERNIEVYDEDGQHIEMNLGLGVLEEKVESQDSDDEDMSDEDDEQRDIMRKLMGAGQSQAGIHIQEVGEG
jgi:hypothetical protein